MVETKKKLVKKKVTKSINSKTSKSKNIVKKTIKKDTTKKAVVKKKLVKNSKLENKKISYNPNSKKRDYKSISIVLGVISLLLILSFSIIYLMKNNSSSQNNVKLLVNYNSSNNSNIVKLTIIEDPNCLECNVDFFANQIKSNLIKNLEVEKISIETKKGKDILNKLNLKQIPVYLFSSNIENLENWTLLKTAFVQTKLDSFNLYLLNPQFVQNKIIIQEPKILKNAIIIGDKTAPITIFEFTDFKCPFCAIAEGNELLVNQLRAQSPNYVPAMPRIYNEYIKTGKVKLVFYNMPSEKLSSNIMPVHLAGLCANDQNKFYEFKNKIFLNRSDWIGTENLTSKLKSYANKLGLDQNKFDSCLDSKKYLDQITNELNYGIELGVLGTPSFFIGKNFLSGAQDYITFKTLIDDKLSSLN